MLDEWANAFQFDPINEVTDTSLGTYCIHEEGTFIPNLTKEYNYFNGLWDRFFDGPINRNGVGVYVLLISPNKEKKHYSFRIQFSCTNNVVEYEALILGLQTTQRRGIKSLRVHGYNELVVNQGRAQSITQKNLLKSYKHRVWDLIEGFEAFNISSLPRNQNKHADRLAAIGAQYEIPTHVVDRRKQ